MQVQNADDSTTRDEGDALRQTESSVIDELWQTLERHDAALRVDDPTGLGVGVYQRGERVGGIACVGASPSAGGFSTKRDEGKAIEEILDVIASVLAETMGDYEGITRISEILLPWAATSDGAWTKK